MVPPDSDRVPPAPPYSGYSYGRTRLRVRGFHALRPGFPKWFPSHVLPTSLSFNPGSASTLPVWAPPLSLAATRGITVVFFSSGYLDVSVPRVGPSSGAAPPVRRVPPFGHPRIYGHLRLPAAFRSLSRPSSPLRAKASPVRPFLTFSSRVSFVLKKFYTFDSWFFFSFKILLQNLSFPICLVLPTCQRSLMNPGDS